MALRRHRLEHSVRSAVEVSLAEIWDPQLLLWESECRCVNRLAWSADGQYLASGSDDRNLQVDVHLYPGHALETMPDAAAWRGFTGHPSPHLSCMRATASLTGWRAVSQLWPFPQGGPRRSIRLMTHHQVQPRLLPFLVCYTRVRPVSAETAAPRPCCATLGFALYQ